MEAVLALSWNSQCEHVLASGGADHKALLWDLNSQTVVSSLGGHKEKVQSLQWNHIEAQTLLTGCCDNTVRMFDCRTPNVCTSWGVAGEVERVLWDHFTPYHCLASTEAGTLHYIDVRKATTPLWTLSAHSEAVTGISISPHCPDVPFVIAAGGDKASDNFKVMDLRDMAPVRS